MEISMSTSNEKKDQPKGLFPVLPTVKVLALGKLTAQATPEQLKATFPKEVPATLRLHLAGKIDQWWAGRDRKGPVFLMNVTSVEEAHSLLDALPLGVAKLMEFDLIELSPLAPLQLLLGEGWRSM
jgi:hypothetical protein